MKKESLASPRMLFSLNKNAGKVVRGEAYVWLKSIHRRLAIEEET
jgi:hypothetical protein